MKLEKTVDLLDAMMERGEFNSDAEMARELNFPQPTVSSWRCGRTYPTEVHALKIAGFLGVNPALVLTIAAADRMSGRPARAEWLKVARALSRAA